jgi:hypothetical protein
MCAGASSHPLALDHSSRLCLLAGISPEGSHHISEVLQKDCTSLLPFSHTVWRPTQAMWTHTVQCALTKGRHRNIRAEEDFCSIGSSLYNPRNATNSLKINVLSRSQSLKTASVAGTFSSRSELKDM